MRTLTRPGGRLLATIATANDVHFGETECGRTGDPATDAIGPVLSGAPGATPYPELMNGAIVDEMLALDPDVVMVKGDLTDTGRAEEYEAFLACYGALGDRMHHVRGNHDAMRDPELARAATRRTRCALDGVALAVLDTVVPGRVGGALPAAQRAMARRARRVRPPIRCSCSRTTRATTPTRTTGSRSPTTRRSSHLVAGHGNIAGYLAGHTHTNRVIRYPPRARSRSSRSRAPRTIPAPGPSTGSTRVATPR